MTRTPCTTSSSESALTFRPQLLRLVNGLLLELARVQSDFFQENKISLQIAMQIGSDTFRMPSASRAASFGE